MIMINTTPGIKIFVNGFQITFGNLYTIIVKNGPGAKCSANSENITDTADLLMAYKFGGNLSQDVEIEIYDPARKNITESFGSPDSMGHVTPFILAHLMYIVSSLK